MIYSGRNPCIATFTGNSTVSAYPLIVRLTVGKYAGEVGADEPATAVSHPQVLFPSSN